MEISINTRRKIAAVVIAWFKDTENDAHRWEREPLCKEIKNYLMNDGHWKNKPKRKRNKIITAPPSENKLNKELGKVIEDNPGQIDEAIQDEQPGEFMKRCKYCNEIECVCLG